ncbi:helix-turn-helix transcriptional regulator [Sphingobium mellinum]|uniref:helix-turn-helix transcriptional regulator n=1 Tax=Sphingobium mellinum TaxID=1387166 RepID=UPI0030EE1DF9
MDVDKAIVDINRAARATGTDQFREVAFDILHGAVHFDTASWSSVISTGLKPQDMRLWRQHDDMIDAYMKMLGSDVVMPSTIEQAGEPLLFNWSSSQDKRRSAPAFRSYCEHSGYLNLLAVMIPNPASNYTSLCLCRQDPGRPFDENEKGLVKRILPHLLNAWVTNHALNPGLELSDTEPCDATVMVCSTSARILGEGTRFKMILGEEFPGWDGKHLPADILSRVNRRGMWSNSRITIRSRPVADVHLLSIQRIGTHVLTSREMEICRRAAAGLSQKEIAQELGISAGTVKNHLYNAYSKLQVKNRVGLAKLLS